MNVSITIREHTGPFRGPMDPFNPIAMMYWSMWLVFWVCRWMVVATAVVTVYLAQVVAGFAARVRYERERKRIPKWYPFDTGPEPSWYDQGGTFPPGVTHITKRQE